MPSLVLASASSARKALLRAAGVEPIVVVSQVDESAVETAARTAYPEVSVAELALTLARAKAEAVAAEVTGDQLILGCDSILEFEGRAYGKPADAADAFGRWQTMRGRSGVLHTGHWLIDDRTDGSKGTLGASAATVVHFAAIDDIEIEAYVATGEPVRVAGGFTLDALGAPFVERIEGDPGTVVGLCLPLLRSMLHEIGLRWADLRR